MRRILAAILVLLIASAWAKAQTIFWKKDYIRDASGATIAVATPQPSDTAAPTAPSNLHFTNTTTTSVELAWNPDSTDTGGSGLAGYVIYRGAIPVGAVPYTATGFTDVGLIPNSGYIYRVVAFDGVHNYSDYGSSAYATTAPASGSPLNLTAAAASNSLIYLSWSAPGSGPPDHYGIWRRSNSSWAKIDTSPSGSYSDTGVSANTAYLYKVSAEDSSGHVQGWTNVDIATTVFFTDDPLAAGSNGTVVKAVHVTDLRHAVNVVRAAAGLADAQWTNQSLSGAWIHAMDVSELRTKLGDALFLLGLSTPNYTDTSLAGVTVKKAHFEELRLRVK